MRVSENKVGEMSFLERSRPALDYALCRYGESRLRFRGPRRAADGRHIAFLGGCETFGRFVRTPFVEGVGDRIGRGCVNLGQRAAGIDIYINDPETLAIAAAARTTVIQVLGAQNLTNRFYKVHPRRNDRFVSASRILRTVYREVDFTEFHFNRHMLGHLRDLSEDRFAIVVDELRTAWSARMRSLCTMIGGDIRLLWIAPEAPPSNAMRPELAASGPLFVTREMLDELLPLLGGDVMVAPRFDTDPATALEQMVYEPQEQAMAAEMLSPAAHDALADRLADWLE